MLYRALVYVTNLGDSALLIFLVLAGMLTLMLQGRYRRMKQFAVMSALGGAGVILLKIFCIRDRGEIFGQSLHSPSGHVAMSMGVYGAYAILISQGLKPRWRKLPYLLCFSLVAAIALSRLFLRHHTPPEVALGACAGGIFFASEYHWFHQGAERSANPWPLCLTLVFSMLLLNGLNLPSERYIWRLAHYS
jgi:membrane-associated phospholipid phosphatase